MYKLYIPDVGIQADVIIPFRVTVSVPPPLERKFYVSYLMDILLVLSSLERLDGLLLLLLLMIHPKYTHGSL